MKDVIDMVVKAEFKEPERSGLVEVGSALDR
jgi:hypothetical protein